MKIFFFLTALIGFEAQALETSVQCIRSYGYYRPANLSGAILEQKRSEATRNARDAVQSCLLEECVSFARTELLKSKRGQPVAYEELESVSPNLLDSS